MGYRVAASQTNRARPARVLPRVVERVESGGTSVRLRVDPAEHEAIRDALRAFSELEVALFSTPTKAEVDDADGALVVSYDRPTEGSQSFVEALPALRRQLPESTPQFIRLALMLWDASTELSELALGERWLGPGDVVHVPEMPHAPWRIRVVPALSETFGERFASGPEAWAWTSADGLARGARPRRTRIVGSALYHAFVGELHPASSGPRGAFERVLRGRAPRLDRLEEALEESLPQTFEAEARELVALVSDLLADDAETRADALRERLDVIARQVSSLRLAVRFEHERHLEIALRLIEDHARSVPPELVAWDTVMRLRWWARDAKGAFEAALHGAELGQADGVRSLLRILRDAAGSANPETTAVLAASLEKIHPRLLETDVVRLGVADFEARVLRRDDRLDALLARPAVTPWYEFVRRLMLTQRAARLGEYAKVASLAEQALAYSAAGGLQASSDGAWAAAHIHYLDGIAHYGAVATYQDTSYLGDALDRFMKAIELGSTRLPASEPLMLACVQWLEWIVVFARQVRAPSLDVARACVEAYLAARGVARGATVAPVGSPPLLWYRIERLLPL